MCVPADDSSYEEDDGSQVTLVPHVLPVQPQPLTETQTTDQEGLEREKRERREKREERREKREERERERKALKLNSVSTFPTTMVLITRF